MSKSILLIDDKEEFKDDFKSTAQRKGYSLAWGKSFEDLVNKLPDLHLNITAIILDIKCLLKNDQEIEKEDFIGTALNYLNRNFPALPRMILTGDEKALENIKLFYNTDTEDVYKKEPKELDRLFKKLEEHYSNYPSRILTYDENEIKELIKKGESKKLEFKSSIQFCVREQIVNKDLRFESFKNLAAFANSDGGEILIGVEDNTNIIGLENTDYNTLKEPNKQDSFRLLLDSLVESYFGNSFQKNLENLKFYSIEDKTICRITVKGKNHSPIFIKKRDKSGKNYEAFFIRSQASARELKGAEKDIYIKAHWEINE
ncbi:putative DNA-binding domain-containing protein [Flavobacterium sp. 9AF]|uniref:ATP-binding protein n=1 Tax=Flavobacterium sp. 9AF TaxID=2653142 RepID=UPI0012F20752|nr:ATP-binding protein [Flavobacterium sp. 9AF]VXC34375.1 putative DNA-binding domain-containing protein [Flavobacterium sp. 9AF]